MSTIHKHYYIYPIKPKIMEKHEPFFLSVNVLCYIYYMFEICRKKKTKVHKSERFFQSKITT